MNTNQENQTNMKNKTMLEPSVQDITECLKNFKIDSSLEKSCPKNECNIKEKSKNEYNILVDEAKNEKDDETKNTKNEKDALLKDNKNDIKAEAKDNAKKPPEAVIKSSPKKDDFKEKEKPQSENKSLGELCARGPGQKVKSTQQSRSLTSPYPQSNAILNNGGMVYHKPLQNQLSSEVCYLSSSIGHANEFSQGFTTQYNSLVPCDANEYISNIQEINNWQELCPLTPNIPAIPEVQSSLTDVNVEDVINEVINDIKKKENVLQHLTHELDKLDSNELLNPPNTQINANPHDTYGNVSPISSPQVVPRSQLSPHSSSSGSPPSPSSPNMYANTPSFSPNIPSPRGYPSDDSSSQMYMYNPSYNSMTPLVPQPLSSCSSTSSTTNNSYSGPQSFDLNDIISSSLKEETMEHRALTLELNQAGTQALKTEAMNIPMSVPVSNGPLQTNPVVITAFLPIPQLPTVITQSSNLSPRLRKILPKITENAEQLQTIEACFAANQPSLPHVPDKRIIKSHTSAKDKLRSRCLKEKIERSWAKVQSRHDEDIAKVDKDGDTCLMILVCNKEVSNKPEQLFALVERCKTVKGVLSAKNKDNYSALYMACVAASHDPLVAQYIAEAMIEVNEDLNVGDHEGFTLIHHLCKVGDKCAKVLNQLLSLRDSRGKTCFDINKPDYEGRSPLHLAVETHYRVTPCHEIVKVLMRNGADVLKQDVKQGSTPLHFAVTEAKADPNLIDTLCNTTKCNELVNAQNYNRNTPLHEAIACGRSIEKQTSILGCLMKGGALRGIRNQNGKTPLELAPEDKKGEIKKILDKFNAK